MNAKQLATTPRSLELVSLSERMVYLQVLRVVLALVVIVAEAVHNVPSDTPLSVFLWATAGYLIASAVLEGLRRLRPGGGLSMIGTMLIVDGVYLAWAMYVTGGVHSDLRFLVYLHLTAVALLASYRTGLKVALWHSLLYCSVFYLDVSSATGGRWGDTDFMRASSLNIAALWLIAIGTAVFSSLNEKELRRQKVNLGALAEMAAELETNLDPTVIGRIVLDKLWAAFDFKRGAVISTTDGRPSILAERGASDARLEAAAEPLLQRSWERRQTLLVKEIDGSANPELAALLPGARNVIVAPLFGEGEPVGALLLEYGGGVTTRVERRVISAVGQFVAHAGLVLRNAWLLQQIKKMAETDALTGLANRRAFERVLTREISRAQRHGETVTLMMLDLDHFKKLNDEHGHQVGDEVLRSTGVTLSEKCRPFDVAARYGGEEFAVVLPSCTSKESLVVADRIRRALSDIGAPTKISASAGVATFPTHATSADALIKAADEALYESKRSGRDRVSRSRRRGARRKTSTHVG